MINGLSLFSGIGGIDVALSEYVQPIAYCEIESYCQSVLLQRMSEGHLPKAPIWDDIRTLPTDQLSPVEIIYGGFPCQDISVAGLQKGLEGKRSGLIFEVFKVIDATRPSFVFLENVPNIRTKGAERVCKELAERGYDCRWCCISASDVGANHKRERWFLLGYSEHNGLDASQKSRSLGQTIYDNEKRAKEASEFTRTDSSTMLANSMHERRNDAVEQVSGLQSVEGSKEIPDSMCEGFKGWELSERVQQAYSRFMHHSWWEVEPSVGRMVNGLPRRVDRIKCLGNAVVPLQVRTAFKFLMGLK